MRILLVGLSKSGTSILAYRIAAALPPPVQLHFEPIAFGLTEGDLVIGCNDLFGPPGSNSVTKCLAFPQYGIDWDELQRCAEAADVAIWLARDPRDRFISDFFYAFYWQHVPPDPELQQRFAANFERSLERTKQKEADPASRSFISLAPHDEALRHQREIYPELTSFVRDLDEAWVVVRYEELVEGRLPALEERLGLPVPHEVEVDASHRRVKRTATSGHWRQWFTEEDCATLRPIYQEYLQVMGYDPDDWALDLPDRLDPAVGSAYMERLFTDRTL